MKKLFSLIAVLGLLFCASKASAAGTVTQVLSIVEPTQTATYTTSVNKPQWGYGDLRYVTITWTADPNDASVPATDIYWDFSGYIIEMTTNPGATAPTSAYDITLVDEQGVDVLGGAGMNLSATASERITPKPVTGQDVWGPAFALGTITFTLTNNSVNSATGTAIITYIQGD